jgi:hypothetical protein
MIDPGGRKVHKLSVTAVGKRLGIELNKDILEKLGVEEGDSVLLLETHIGFEITSYESALQRELDIAETIMNDDRETLRLLARTED